MFTKILFFMILYIIKKIQLNLQIKLFEFIYDAIL